MGRRGAGRSTLLRLIAGLIDPTRGKVTRAGRVALLLQNPGDYFLHDRIGDDVPNAGALADRHPRDVSGGERQRLALELVLASGSAPVAVCLDEPTRGMDRAHGAALAARLRELAASGTAVLVATHDPEFAAKWAARTILLGDGRPVADAPTADVLGGGWYFATQTARVLGRELGRLSLAAACAAASLAFGAVMNLHLWVTYSGDHTAAKLTATFATSLPFDLAHAVGSTLFCLAFGPALVRALARYRTRFEIR